MNFYVHDYFTSGPQVHAPNTDARIFVVCVWESLIPDLDFLTRLAQLPNPVTLVLNSWTKHIAIDPRFDVFYIDFFLWRSYNEIVVKQKNKLNASWNSASKKFLFLTGKPEKLHRIKLLYELEQAGITDHAVVSLFVNPANTNACRQILDLEEQEFQRFVNKFNHSPDFVGVPEASSIHYGGIPYDPKLFATRFRLISETAINSFSPWITEKTWITILNRQPFLIAGDAGTCKKLRSMGFSTFDAALRCSYDHVKDWNQRKQALMQNINHWLKTNYNFSNEVDHNYNTIEKIAQDNLSRWQNYCSTVNMEIDINSVIDTTDPQQV